MGAKVCSLMMGEQERTTGTFGTFRADGGCMERYVTPFPGRGCLLQLHSLDDPTVSISPYFKLKDIAKFKAIWKAAFDPFAHKKDCVHYAFTFNTAADGTVHAHCREAYTNAAAVLQHLADVDGPLKAALEVAELERLEVHGPAAEVEKLREALTPLGCKFFVTEWGFRPSKPQQEKDTVCHLYPYFTLKDASAFKKIWGDAYAATEAAAEAEKSHMYAFAFEEETTAYCREAYADAEGLLLHLKNVDGPLKAVLDPAVAELLRLELHAPASEIEKLRPTLEPLGCEFFEIAWGFRNAAYHSLALTDPTVSLSPYFKVKDVATFKAIWKGAFNSFKHKEDCVHYAFTFHTAQDGVVYAHCREAYSSAETVLQHLADVDGPLKHALKVAELLRLEVHGPAAEVEKLKEALTPLGCNFFEAEWGFRISKPQQEETDTVCHLYPYFTVRDAPAFKKIWGDAYAATQAAAEAENSISYAFAFDGETTALCREAYADADSVLLHLKNVDGPFKAALNPAVAVLKELELHGPASEIEKLKPALLPLGCRFFETEWGFRN